MRKDKWMMVVALLVISLLVLPLLGACGEAEKEIVEVTKVVEVTKEVQVTKEVEVTKEVPLEIKKTLKLGCIYDFGGPVSYFGVAASRGANDYFNHVNETGYLPGVKLEWSWLDGKSDPARVALHYKTFKAEGIDMLFLQMGSDAAVVRSMAEKDNLTVLSWGGVFKSLFPPTGPFSVVPTWDGAFAGTLRWVHDEWDYEKMGRNPKVVSLSAAIYEEDLPSVGEAYGEELKVDHVLHMEHPVPTFDYSSYVTRMKEADPDYIYLFGMGHATPILEMHRQGLIPDGPEIVSVVIGSMPIPKLITSLTPEILADIYTMSPHGPLLADKEGANLARDIFLKYHGTDPGLVDEVEHDVMYQMGFSQAYTTVEGIKNAIEMVGAENVDTAAIYDGLEKTKFTLDGMMPPVEYSPERHYGVATQNLYKIVDGIMVQTDVLNCPTPDEVAEARK